MLTIAPDTRHLAICEHAAQRWAERVRQDPQMPVRDARQDLERCAQGGQLTAVPPIWMATDPHDDARYLMVGPDVAVVLRRRHPSQPMTAVTVMTPHDEGSVHAAACRRRRHRRQRRRSQP